MWRQYLHVLQFSVNPCVLLIGIRASSKDVLEFHYVHVVSYHCCCLAVLHLLYLHTKTQSANRCVNTISATPLDSSSDTTLHVHSETTTHPQKTHGYQEAGPRVLQKTVTHVSTTATYIR
jgi:hypothetical protein